MEMMLLDVNDIARELKIPKTWIYSRTRLKGPERIPHVKIGKYCRFRIQDVIEWLEQKDGARV